MDALGRLNALPEHRARAEFLRCCGSPAWVDSMVSRRPYRSAAQLYGHARGAWETLPREQWLEAFKHHPKIGDLAALKEKWAAGEQAGAAAADEATLKEFAELNGQYELKFGFIFIVCATGKTAPEMLSLLKFRLANRPETELRLAANEQAKIIRLRLEKLLQSC